MPRQRATKSATAATEAPVDIEVAARTIEVSRTDILKAEQERRSSGVLAHPDEADTASWEGVGAITPPYDPTVLLTLHEHSNSLRQCVDAYATNIDGNGHVLDPVIDLNAVDVDERVAAYVMARRLRNDPATVSDPRRQVARPTDEEILKAKEELGERMRAEQLRLEEFFDHACLDHSFVALRRMTRQDLEIQGNAYWEVTRSNDGALAGFAYIPAFTVRHMPADKRAVPCEVRVKVRDFDYTTIHTKRRFRRFVQMFEAQIIWFKELGDPRTVSRKTGAIYPSPAALEAAEPGAEPASEVLHFRVHASRSSYGVPRWVGNLLSVLGSRQAEEVNHSYFENKSVPPLAVLVSGGRISNNTVGRIKEFLENDIKGKRNFHKILVLEGETAGTSSFDQGRLKISLQPLTAAQHNDALFQNYDERNIDKVGQAFRLPRMLRGDIRDFNRATADAALEFAESQVFKPERDEFDFAINRRVMTLLGARFWRFKSVGVNYQSPKDQGDLIARFGEVGFITPSEGRDLISSVFNRPFQKITEPWASQPLSLTLGGVSAMGTGGVLAPGMTTPQSAATGAPAAPLVASVPDADMGAVTTVNEAREASGRGRLQLPDGSDDPDGWLTIVEFRAKVQARQQAQLATAAASKAKAPPATTSEEGVLRFANELLTLRKALLVVEHGEAAAAFANAKTTLGDDPP